MKRNKIENSKLDPHICSYLIFSEGTKQSNRETKESIFNQMVLEQLNTHMRKNEPDPHLTPFTKTNLRWIRD